MPPDYSWICDDTRQNKPNTNKKNPSYTQPRLWNPVHNRKGPGICIEVLYPYIDLALTG